MALDPSIPLQTQPVNPMGALSSVLNVQNQQAQLQGAQQQNQQGAIALQERQGVQGVLSNIKNYQDSQGNVDFNKLTPDIMAVAPTTGAQVLTGLAQAQSAATLAHAQVNDLDAASRKTVGDALYSLKGQAPDVVQSTLQGLKQAYPGLGNAVDYLGKYILAPHAADPKQLDAALDSAGKFVQTSPTQQQMNTPGGVTVNNNQTSKVVSTTPGTSVPVGQTIPGTETTMQLPPTTTVASPTGGSTYVGAQPAEPSGPAVFDMGNDRVANLQMLNSIANDPKQPPAIQQQARAKLQQLQTQQAAPVAASAAPAQLSNVQNNVDEMNRHFGSLQDQSGGAQLVAGLTGNIKALATTAATGTLGDKKSYVDGLLTAFHIPGATGDLQKDTDLLEKNMAQLNLGTPASSDAGRALVQAARPHSSMNAAAIGEAADQVASQVQANMAMRNMLAPAKMMGDTATYQAQRQKLEQIADPRAWQYVNLGPGTPAAKAFMSKLQPADQAALIQKVDQLEQMGMLK